MLNAVEYVDIIIPRGSQGLINFVREHAKVPVIETGAGIVHVYFDKDGDVDVFLSGSPTVMTARAGYYTPTTLYYQNRSGGSYIGFGGSKKELIQVALLSAF